MTICEKFETKTNAMTNKNQPETSEPLLNRRVWVRLSAPGIYAEWLETPEGIQALLECAGRCMTKAHDDLKSHENHRP